MKQTDPLNELQTKKSSARKLCKALLFLAGIFSYPVSAQLSYTFTAAGVTGSVGPTQSQINTAYASTSLSGSVTIVTQGIQQFTVPISGMYHIETRGAQGYGPFGGRGATMAGDFNLTAGQVLKVLVGQSTFTTGAYTLQYGGGGGTYVTDINNSPFIVAGGGGGSHATSFQANSDGTVSTSGNSGLNGTNNAAGGTNGNGGASTNTSADGGGGLLTDGGVSGTIATPGRAFVNGGVGGGYRGIGGFGGGSGTASYNDTRAGGGGGYSGGGGSHTPGTGNPQAGGGGSYNNGANQVNTSGSNTGSGLVIITSLCNVNVATTSSLICTGGHATLTTNAISNYSWSTGNTTSSVIVVSPTVTTNYTVSGTGTSPSGCTAYAVVTITVNNTPTVTISSSTTSACLGQSVTLTANGANTYTWNNNVSNGVAFAPGSTTTYTVAGTNACSTATAGITITVSALPVTAVASSTLICAGSPATLTAGGATTYTWMPGSVTTTNYIVSPTSTTAYTVTGNTGNCNGVATIVITTKAVPSISISTNNATLCNGSTGVLNALGNAITYTWNPTGQTGNSISVSPTNTAVYSVTGTNSLGCTSSVSQVILVNPNPTLTISSSDAEVCSGGSPTLTVSGAVTYTWDGSNVNTYTTVVTPTVSASYNVTGSYTTGCQGSAMITVNVFEPTFSIGSNTAVCKGSPTPLSAGDADSYTWSNGAQGPFTTVTPTLTTVYTVTAMVTSANGIQCSATNTILVTVNDLPVISATAEKTSICSGKSTSLTALGAGATGTYTWAGGLGNTAVISVSPIANQTYTVSGKDANGCKSSGTVAVSVSPCTSINTIAANAIRMMIYPNPSNGEFTISTDQNITLNIVNELGQQVRTITLNSTTPDVKINNLANGIYFITGANENGSVKQKIVITR